MLNDVPVERGSKLQRQTADSPAAAEILAVRDAVAAGRLYTWRCRDMGIAVEDTVTIHTDNMQAKSYAEGTCIKSKLGGVFDKKEDWVRELQDSNKVKLFQRVSPHVTRRCHPRHSR